MFIIIAYFEFIYLQIRIIQANIADFLIMEPGNQLFHINFEDYRVIQPELENVFFELSNFKGFVLIKNQ